MLEKLIQSLLVGLVLMVQPLGIGLFDLLHADFKHLLHEFHVLLRDIGRNSTHHTDRRIAAHGVLRRKIKVEIGLLGQLLMWKHAGHELGVVNAFILDGKTI
jgi:hypothetical protein